MARRTRLRGGSGKARSGLRRTASKSKGRADSRRRAGAPAAAARKGAKPIDLYYWPTSNGMKVSIMLEECRLPYVVKPVNPEELLKKIAALP